MMRPSLSMRDMSHSFVVLRIRAVLRLLLSSRQGSFISSNVTFRITAVNSTSLSYIYIHHSGDLFSFQAGESSVSKASPGLSSQSTTLSKAEFPMRIFVDTKTITDLSVVFDVV